MCVDLLVVIARKRLNLPASPRVLLNLYEVSMFEKIPLDQLVTNAMSSTYGHDDDNQLNLL